MKTVVVKNVVAIVLVLRCILVSAQDTCIYLKIDSNLSLRISNCTIPKATPRILLKYSDTYANATLFGGLDFNDSIYHDSTELVLKQVDICVVGFTNPKDTSIANLVVMKDFLNEPPCGWTNRKRNRFLNKLSKELYNQFQKMKFTLIIKEQLSFPFFIGSIDMTFFEYL